MANLDDIEIMDTYLFSDGITSKYSDDDNTDVMSMRWYTKNMEDLIEHIDKINCFGVDSSTDESIEKTSSIQVDKRFILDVVKSTIVNHTKNTLGYMQETLELNKKVGEHKNE